ncbi:MAG: hypothetical protein JWO05_2868 [Gemmatimonadetes bacterium]|nr:hypothetical protein [Gemmatimonadota bacterium]
MKYKVIKSAAHNFGHSFVSLMNWSGDDYTMSHLAREVVERDMPVLEVDLLSGRAAPQALLVPPVGASVTRYLDWFPKLLVSQRIDPAVVRAASLRIQFQPERRSVNHGFSNAWEIPFECLVAIEDDRGKRHEGRVRAFWTVDDSFAPPRALRRAAWWLSQLRGAWYRFKRSVRDQLSNVTPKLTSAGTVRGFSAAAH